MTKNEASQILAELPTPLLYWFRANARVLPWRSDPTPYHVWLSEIMLQQTRVEAVKPYYTHFLSLFPDIASLARADDEVLHKCWEGLGYYSRARNLKRCAIAVMTDCGGEMPKTAKELEALPGIGPYTAGAIASIAFGEPSPAVDGNVLRVITRLTGDERDIGLPATKREISDALAAVYPRGDCSAFTQGLMELGAVVCVPNGAPHCDVCPVSHLCHAYTEGSWDMIPSKQPKKPRKIVDRVVFLFTCNGKIALCRRPESGLLAGLWEFPSADAGSAEADALFALLPSDAEPVGTAKHIFTHIEWHMTGYRAQLSAKFPNFTWVTPAEISEQYTIPSAYRYFKKLVQTP